MLFDVLSRHLNVFEPHFLEASAGTGKTFAIEHLVTRMLIESDPPFSIEQILVVTFTRAATRELKWRIRRNLFQTKEGLLGKSPPFDYLKALVEQGEDALKVAIERIDSALICFDSAQIFTLHGFCHRLLSEFAFEAEVGMQLSDPDEKEYLPVLEKMIKEHLKEDLCSASYSPMQIKTVLKKKQSDPRKLIASLAELVGSGKEIAESPSHTELLGFFLKEINDLPSINKELFKADLSLLIPHYKLMTAKEIPAQVDAFAEILFSKKCSQKQFDQFCNKEFFLNKMNDGNKKVRAKFPEPSALHYPFLTEQLRTRLLPLLESAADPSRIFLRLAKDLQAKSQTILEQTQRFSPDTLLLKVKEALQKPRFVQCVQKKFRAAIIDEFQDTDPIQWEIFDRLFLSKLEAVCLVGDPKQSIYAFRNADLHIYLEAAKAMGPYARKYLDTNFRSTPPLVDALNLLFSRAQKGWMDLPGQKEPLEVPPVKAGAGLILNSDEPPITFFLAMDKKGRSKKFPTAEMMEHKVLPFLASEIFKLHTEKEIPYHEIAVLIKDRFQGREVIDYLKACNIPAKAKREGSVMETVAYFALKEILAAVCAPSDKSRVKAALGGPLIAWAEEQLEGSFLLEAKAKMQSLHRTLFEEGFGPFFESFLSTVWGSKPLLQELFLRGDVQHYLNLRKLAEVLIEEEIARGLKGEEFLLFLEEMVHDADESRLKIPSGEEKGSVTVMTIHMSKGLEFEAVFALGLASRHKPGGEIKIKEEGRSVITPLNLSDPASLRAIEELDAEKMRQLYVALTRAKRHLYIPLMIEEEQKEIEFGEASPSELFFSKLSESGQCTDAEVVEERCKNPQIPLFGTQPKVDLKNVLPVLDSLSPLICYRILEDAPKTQLEKEQRQIYPFHLNRTQENRIKSSHFSIQRAGLMLNSTLTPPFESKSEAFNRFACGYDSGGRGIDEIARPISLPLNFHDEKVLSFSSLAKKEHAAEIVRPLEGALLFPHTLPLGAETGHLLHLLLEKVFKRRLHHPLDESRLSELIDEELLFSPLEKWKAFFLSWIVDLLKRPLASFSLSDVPAEQMQQEVEFLFPLEEGKMKGFADLLFEMEGKYYILDWKSNYLGPTDSDYTQERIAQAMEQNQYSLQASIYAEALRRYVKLFDNRPFSEVFGGAIYYFIRGKAVYHFFPEAYSKAYS